MSHTGIEVPDRMERLRRRLAPPIALLASTMGIICLLNVRSVLRSLPALTATDPQFVGWVGAGALLCIAAAAVALLAVERIGPGPPLTLGAAAGVVGLTLGHDIGRHGQLPWAIAACCSAAGALLAGGAGMSSTLPGTHSAATAVAWAAPVAGVWALLTRLAPERDGRLPDVVVNPHKAFLVVMTTAIIVWSLGSMLVEPVPPAGPADRRGWEDSWSVLLLLCAVSTLLATLVGFDPTISPVWARPVVIAATAAVAGGWALVGLLLPSVTVRLAYVAVSAVTWLMPATLSFSVGLADSGPGRLGWPAVYVLLAAGAAGAVVGWLGPLAVIPLGLGVAALSCLPVWAMSEGSLAMSASTALLTAAATAVMAGALRVIAPDSRATRWIAMAAICALVLGQLDVVPLSWAMLGDIPVTVDGMQAAGRLWAGLTAACASVAAAFTWVACGRILGSAAPGGSPPVIGRRKADARQRARP